MTSLSLLQLVSPALPVGAFSYSEGLEVLIQNNTICDETALLSWLEAELQQGVLRIDAAALRPLSTLLSAWSATSDDAARERLFELDSWLQASHEAAEVRAQQRQMGDSLIQLLADLGHHLPDQLRLGWPSAWAWACVALKIDDHAMVQGYLYSWVANQLSAAVRLLPLGPSRAQLLQHKLGPLILAQAAELQLADPRELWSSGVGAGLAQLTHAELYSRLFRS